MVNLYAIRGQSAQGFCVKPASKPEERISSSLHSAIDETYRNFLQSRFYFEEMSRLQKRIINKKIEVLGLEQMHEKGVVRVVEELGAVETGLRCEEVAERQDTCGKGELEEVKPVHPFIVFLSQFKDLLVIILIAAAVISMVSGELESTIVILTVITINTILGTVQDIKAQKSLDTLKQLSIPHSRVLRNGTLMEVSSQGLTVGNILFLEAGDVVGADGRIIEDYSLQVNGSALTGEVESVHKTAGTITGECSLGDQKNMAFSSGLVTYGHARVVVTAIGMKSEIGRIATLMNTAQDRKTPLQKVLGDFSKKLSIAIITICILVLALNIWQGNAVMDALIFAVALAVAAIPEALVNIVTIVLAMGTSQMAKENAIIKNISSVKSLGCVSVICSDKTGTLTRNKMTVQQIYWNHELLYANNLREPSPLDRLLPLDFALCCDTTTNEYQRIGDLTELALVDLLELCRVDGLKTREKYPRIDENLFDSERELMSTLHVIDGESRLLLRGACDEVLKKATYIQTEQGIRDITEGDCEHILKMNHTFADNGLHVLDFATWPVEKDHIEAEDENQLIFLGLVSLMDPPCEKSRVAIENCRRVDITPVMITGGHKVTTRNIAKALGVYRNGDQCVDGMELNAMNKEKLVNRLEHIRVYAHVTPKHKIRIVNTWQKKGKIVTMAGDDINDTPALKQADIGIAMGITGTEVSKDVASMILTDGNFVAIIKAVAAGRNIYANIKNAIIYLLSGNLSGVICVLTASLLSPRVPFLPAHLLFINLVTDSLPAIAIEMERSTKDILREEPRNPSVGILTPATMKQLRIQGILTAVVTMSACFLGLKESWAIATIMAFSTLCLSKLFHSFNCRSQHSLYHIGLFTNKYSVLAFVIGFCFLNAILLWQPLHPLFSVTAITMTQLFTIYGPALIPATLIQFGRMLRHRQ